MFWITILVVIFIFFFLNETLRISKFQNPIYMLQIKGPQTTRYLRVSFECLLKNNIETFTLRFPQRFKTKVMLFIVSSSVQIFEIYCLNKIFTMGILAITYTFTIHSKTINVL